MPINLGFGGKTIGTWRKAPGGGMYPARSARIKPKAGMNTVRIAGYTTAKGVYVSPHTRLAQATKVSVKWDRASGKNVFVKKTSSPSIYNPRSGPSRIKPLSPHEIDQNNTVFVKVTLQQARTMGVVPRALPGGMYQASVSVRQARNYGLAPKRTPWTGPMWP